MREIISHAYLLKGTEFALLLSGSGNKSIYCFPFISGDENREQYIYAVESLAGRGIITPYDSGFSVNPPYNEMMDYIKKSETVSVFRTPDTDISDFCVYSSDGDKVLSVSLPSRKESVRLSFETGDDFFRQYITEILPDESESTLEPSDEAFDESALRILDTIRNGEPVDDLNFLLGIDILSNKGEERRTVLVLQMPRGVYLIMYDGIGAVAEKYTKKNTLNLIESIVKGI